MNEYISLGNLRTAARDMPSQESPYFKVFFSPDLRDAITDLPNFLSVSRYGMLVASPAEFGVVERFRFFEDALAPPHTWSMKGIAVS